MIIEEQFGAYSWRTQFKFMVTLGSFFIIPPLVSGWFVNCRIGVSVRIHLLRVYNSQHESDIMKIEAVETERRSRLAIQNYKDVN